MKIRLGHRERKHSDHEGWPVPPAEIRYRILSQSDTEELFLAMASECQDSIEAGLAKVERKMTDFHAVLDWGAGCGRIMRQWSHLFATISFHGTDVDKVMIDWDQKNLPGVEWKVNGADPPLAWSDSSFDLVYGASVFTHLDSERQRAWSEELVRVSKADGIVMLSTLGPFVFDVTFREQATPEQLAAFDEDGYLRIASHHDGVLPEWYQTTFQRAEHLQRSVSSGLVPLIQLPQGMTGYQDLTIFRVEK